MNDAATILGPLAAVGLVGVHTPGPNFFAPPHMLARYGRRAEAVSAKRLRVGILVGHRPHGAGT